MPDLEQTLTRIGRELEWPETPDLAATVTARLRGAADQASPARERVPAPARARLRGLLPPAGLRRALVLALVSLLVLAGAVFAAVPSARDAVLEFFGLQGATVERPETLPPPPPVRALDLGVRTTLDEAAEQLGFEPLVPAELGEPDGVYVRSGVPGGELSLTYAVREDLPRARTTRLGLLLSEFRGDLSPEYLGKLAGPGTHVERLQVDGGRALWIEGAQHFFFYRAPDGEFIEHELRVAQNVLLLEQGRLLVRLEGAFDRDRAIEIARSLR
jgi:hypothetical protein